VRLPRTITARINTHLAIRTLCFAVWQLKQGEEKMIADRLVEIFSDAPKA